MHQSLHGGRSLFAISSCSLYRDALHVGSLIERFGPSTGGEALSPKEGVFVLGRRPAKTFCLMFNRQKKSCLPNLLPVFLTPNWLVAVLIAGFVLEVVGRFRVVFVVIESREFLFANIKDDIRMVRTNPVGD